MTINAIKILMPAILSFSIGILLSPFFIKILLKYEMWKKKNVEKALDGSAAILTQKIHNDEIKKVPRLGGAVIWFSVILTSFVFWILPRIFDIFPEKIDFISRNQTWLIIFGMLFAGILGGLDDISSCGKKVFLIGNKGLSFLWRLVIIFTLSLAMGYWFFYKLGFTSIFIPFFGSFYIDIGIIFLISFFTIVMFSTSIIDGIDGLSGGLFAIAFASFGIIAVSQSQIDIAAFCFAVVGACFAFLWFNIAPAKFYNSETGMLSLIISLTLVAFLTNQILSLIIISIPLLSAPVSAVIQILSKKYRNGKKVFLIAPIHYHFQMKGMQQSSIVMKYWVSGIICSFLGIVFALAGSL